MKCSLCAVFLLLCATLVQSQETKSRVSFDEIGNGFLEDCDIPATSQSSMDAFMSGSCIGYIIGFDQAINVLSRLHNQPQPYCTDQKVTNDQLLRVMLKFLKDNPSKTHMRTSILMMEAFMGAFPCKDVPQKK